MIINKKKLIFTSDKHSLVGNLFHDTNNQTGLLFLHGGGKATKERYTDLQEYLLQSNYSSFAIDFHGVGESEGTFENSTLEQRLRDGQEAYQEFRKYVPNIIIVGCSMGGHIAARLTELIDASGLILLYAAAYGKEAEDKLLNQTFTDVLRKENSWQDSPALLAVKNYTKSTLVMYGEHDTIVQKEVQNAYKAVLNKKGKFVTLPHASHLFLSPTNQKEEIAKHQAYQEITDFLSALY